MITNYENLEYPIIEFHEKVVNENDGNNQTRSDMSFRMSGDVGYICQQCGNIIKRHIDSYESRISIHDGLDSQNGIMPAFKNTCTNCGNTFVSTGFISANIIDSFKSMLMKGYNVVDIRACLKISAVHHNETIEESIDRPRILFIVPEFAEMDESLIPGALADITKNHMPNNWSFGMFGDNPKAGIGMFITDDEGENMNAVELINSFNAWVQSESFPDRDSFSKFIKAPHISLLSNSIVTE